MFDPSKELLNFTNVTFSYNGIQPILENTNLSISCGEFACVVGPNGGGKTTFIKLILGLLKPSSGNIKVLGNSPKNARNAIGYVPQHTKFDNSFPVTVLDVVLMGALNKNFWWEPIHKNKKIMLGVQ